MTLPPRANRPAERIEQAKRHVLAAKRAAESASAERLRSVLKLSAREQLTALDDPCLNSADRGRLRTELSSRLPRRGRRRLAPRRFTLRRLASRMLRVVLSTPALIALTVGGGWFALAIVNTRPLVMLTGGGSSGVVLRDGSTMIVTLVPGVVYPLLGRAGEKVVLGQWFEKVGYVPFNVPAQAVQPYP